MNGVRTRIRIGLFGRYLKNMFQNPFYYHCGLTIFSFTYMFFWSVTICSRQDNHQCDCSIPVCLHGDGSGYFIFQSINMQVDDTHLAKGTTMSVTNDQQPL